MGRSSRPKPWNHFDDWALLGLIAFQLVFFGIFFSFIPRGATIVTSVVPYNLAVATRPNTDCALQNFNPNCISGFVSYIEMPCSVCNNALAAPGDQLEFKYLWFISGYFTTTCRNKQDRSPRANSAFDMAKWDDPAITLADRAANTWTFALNYNNGNTSAVFGGAQTFDLVVPTPQVNSYPATPWNSFNIELIDVLARYQKLGSVLISNQSNFNIESIVADFPPLEARLQGKMRPPPGGPAYNNDMSNAIAACNQGLMMECKSIEREGPIDFMLRLFGYTTIFAIIHTFVILVRHAWKKAQKSQAASSSLNTPLMQQQYHP